MNNPRAHDFHYIYANGYTVSMTDQEMTIRFGVNEGEDGRMFEQVGIVVNHSSAKLLGLILSRSIEAVEKMSGREIPITPSGAEKVEEMVAALANAAKPAQHA